MQISELSKQLGLEIEPALLELALTHSTFAYEHHCESNERLEFLGDAVLGLLVSGYVYRAHADLGEGELSKLKNAVVSAKALATAAKQINLGDYLRLGKGELASGGRNKVNLLADAFEALLGAAYLSGGLALAGELVERHVIPLLAHPEAIRENADPKTSLVELLHSRGLEQIRYEISFLGPDPDRVFTALAFSGETFLGGGQGPTKRGAEMQAAIAGLAHLKGQ